MNKKGEISQWVFDVFTAGILGIIAWKLYQAAKSKTFDIKKLFKKGEEKKDETKPEDKKPTIEDLKKEMQETKIKAQLAKAKKELEKAEEDDTK